jgi:hypothetical protein
MRRSFIGEIQQRRAVRAAFAGVEGRHGGKAVAARQECIAERVLGRSEGGNDSEPSDGDPGGHARVRYHCADEAATALRASDTTAGFKTEGGVRL